MRKRLAKKTSQKCECPSCRYTLELSVVLLGYVWCKNCGKKLCEYEGSLPL